MEWNGMEWNGMEWNGMEWNGMEWNGMEWNGMEWNGMERATRSVSQTCNMVVGVWCNSITANSWFARPDKHCIFGLY